MENRLPDFVIAALYKNVLVSKNDKKNLPGEPEITKLKTNTQNNFKTGNNKKNIVFLIKEDMFNNASPSIKLLNGILAACHFNLDDALIINFLNQKMDYAQIKEQFKPKQLFLFGIAASELDMPFIIPHFQIQHYDNCSIVLLPDIKNFIGDTADIKAQKRKLWESLKIIFNL